MDRKELEKAWDVSDDPDLVKVNTVGPINMWNRKTTVKLKLSSEQIDFQDLNVV